MFGTAVTGAEVFASSKVGMQNMADDYSTSKYHLSDRSSPQGGDDFVTYDGL
jgi:hypothetical protein